MKRLEISGAVLPLYWSLGIKGLNHKIMQELSRRPSKLWRCVSLGHWRRRSHQLKAGTGCQTTQWPFPGTRWPGRLSIVERQLKFVCPSMALAWYHLSGLYKFQGAAAVYWVQFCTPTADRPTDYTAAIPIRWSWWLWWIMTLFTRPLPAVRSVYETRNPVNVLTHQTGIQVAQFDTAGTDKDQQTGRVGQATAGNKKITAKVQFTQ